MPAGLTSGVTSQGRTDAEPSFVNELRERLALLAASAVAQAQSGPTSYDLSDPSAQGGNESGGAVIVDGYPADPGYAAPHCPNPYCQDPGCPAHGGGAYGVQGAMYQPPYGNNHPGTIYPPYTPQTMAPWPAISPFEPAQVGTTQHRQEDGLWFREQMWKQREWEASIEAVRFDFQEPNDARIGSRTSRTTSSNNTSGSQGNQGPRIFTYGQGPTLPLNEILVGPGAFPFVFLRQGNAPTSIYLAILDRSLFPIRNADVLGGGLDSSGTRFRFVSATDEDGTGWNATGFYATEANVDFIRGRAKMNGIPITQEFLLTRTDQQLVLFSKNGGLPLIDGVTFPNGINGSTMKYDILFSLDYDTQAAGGELNAFMGTLYKSDTTRITSFVGARYFYLDEHFGFRGIDSGFHYQLDTVTFRPPAGNPGNVLFLEYPLLKAYLNSDVVSHMAGPQVGMKYEIGRKGNFRLWGHSAFGLLANHESLEVTGDNIGDPALIAHPEMHNGFEFLDNSFKDNETHTHVSPLLEQSIYADMKLAHLVPFLENSYYLENASLRLGWTWTGIGGVSRPTDSIDWKGFPLFPSVSLNRRSFSMNQLSIGIECPF